MRLPPFQQALAGTGLAERLVKSAYAFVSELQAVDMRYSDGFRYYQEFADVTLSGALAAGIGAGCFTRWHFACILQKGP